MRLISLWWLMVNISQGYFQCLFSCIENLLASLNVKNLVLPAADEAESLWKDRFGFKKLDEEKVCALPELYYFCTCMVQWPCFLFNFLYFPYYLLRRYISTKNTINIWWYFKKHQSCTSQSPILKYEPFLIVGRWVVLLLWGIVLQCQIRVLYLKRNWLVRTVSMYRK